MITNIKKSLSNHFSFFDEKYKVAIALAITLSTITKTSLFNEIDSYEILLFNFFCFTSMLFIFFTLANKLTIYLVYRKMTSNLEKELAKTIILLSRANINLKQTTGTGEIKNEHK